MNTDTLAAYLDDILRVAEIPDYDNAWNGLQVQNSGQVTRLAAAVDASQSSIRGAAEAGCDCLLVHHGLFWDGVAPVTGRRYRRLKLLLDHDMSLYSAHLPLDAHPDLGNNARLAHELGVNIRGSFGNYRGSMIGVWGDLSIPRERLAGRLGDIVGGNVRLIAGGPGRISRVGVVTGGAGGMIGEAVRAGLDAFVTGEGAHHTYFDAVEGGINVYYAGHYATETFGVRALAAHLHEKFGLPWEFVDCPTGM